ncbi:MAG: hypothetical protein WA052_03970 [Microgenomates group bacterium]
MFIQIVFLIFGIVLLVIGAPMAEGGVSDPYNIYKMIVGAEMTIAGVIIVTLSFFAIFPQLSPF